MQPKQVTYYLAGPMSGIPQYNYPEFNRISKELRAAGYTVINPAETDSAQYQKEALLSKDGLVDGQMPIDSPKLLQGGENWGQIMARDVRLIFEQCDGVVVMGDWQKSRGARLEVFVADLCKRPVFVYEGNGKIRDMGEAEYLRGITGIQGFQIVSQVGL